MAAKATVFKNLYHVERTDDYGGYDQYSHFVVCCENESEARLTHPGRLTEEWLAYKADHLYDGWVSSRDVDSLKVTFLGQAAKDVAKGVVCASFHAG